MKMVCVHITQISIQTFLKCRCIQAIGINNISLHEHTSNLITVSWWAVFRLSGCVAS